MSDEFLAQLNDLAASRAEINLLNVFEGVPLSFSAKILGFRENSIDVLTDQHQAVCMFFEKKTFIQSKRLPEILQADVLGLDPIQRIATLSNFSRVKSGIGNRLLVRVQPKDPLEGSIKNQHGKPVMRGELADISQDGIAIYLPEEQFTPTQFYPGANLTVSLRLPGVYVTRLPKTGISSNEAAPGRFDRSNVRYSPNIGRENR
jgi:hypothetical protein